MSEEEPPGESTHGPVRRRLITGMTAIFVVLLASMLVLGAVLVIIQIVGLIIVNRDVVSGASAALSPWTFGVAGALGIWTLLLAYAHGWKSAE